MTGERVPASVVAVVAAAATLFSPALPVGAARHRDHRHGCAFGAGSESTGVVHDSAVLINEIEKCVAVGTTGDRNLAPR